LPKALAAGSHARGARLRKDVKLKDVTADNWEAVVDLELDDQQQELVADNAYSLAESKFNTAARPRAVYAGKRIVGFLMYETLEAEGKPYEAVIYRFMIDRKQQGKGYGRAALARAIDEIRRDARVKSISINYMPDNPVAKQFYASFGFVEVGHDEDGEMIAQLAI
jgi:diamine N-acetyltransferase